MNIRKFMMVVGLPLVLAGCGADDDINPAIAELSIYNQARLTGEQPFVAEGNSVVFHRYYRRQDDKNIADDEYAEDFFLELENPGERFDLDTEELQSANTLFRYYCFCGYTDHFKLKEGSVSGVKSSAGSYQLSVDVTYEYYMLNPDSGDTLNTFTQRVAYSGTHHVAAIPGGSN